MTNFDMSWFLTLPGILIIAGVVLLLISLILFIVSSKGKKNKKEKSATPEEVPTPPVVPTEQPAQAINPQPQVEQPNEVVNNVVEAAAPQPQVAVSETPTVNPVENNADVTPTEQVQPVEQPIAQPTVEPVVESPTPVAPEPVIPATDIDKIAEVPQEPVVETAPAEQPTEIYGGATPSVEIPKEEEKHEIYGGANPLDKTQTIPTINQSAPYGEPAAPVVNEPQPVEQPVQNTQPETQAQPQEATIVEPKEDKDVEVLL
ncbi:MAG: hypothetical protein ACI4OT_04940 [Bacilli bacterium]